MVGSGMIAVPSNRASPWPVMPQDKNETPFLPGSNILLPEVNSKDLKPDSNPDTVNIMGGTNSCEVDGQYGKCFSPSDTYFMLG